MGKTDESSPPGPKDRPRRFHLASCLAAAVIIAYWLRFEVQIQPVTKGLPPFHMYLLLVPVVAVLYPLVFYFQGLYQRRRIRSRFDESMRVAVAVLLDGREAALYLENDSLNSTGLSKAALELADQDPQLRMPYEGSALRLALSEMDK